MPTTFALCAPESDTPAEGVFRFADLWPAYLACRRGKRRSASAQRYALNLFDQLLATVAALNTRQWKPSAATAFVVTRPKAREVLAAAFADRVVHHWLVPPLERQFEPVFIFDAWSNRQGKGIHGAVQRLRGFMQAITANGARDAWSLQLDIANFFNRIDRAGLFGLLQRRLLQDTRRASDDPRSLSVERATTLLWLSRRILTGNAATGARLLGDPAHFSGLPPHKRLINAPPGKGLPIGNLTSQFFANVMLNELDQFVKHTLKVRYYLRYVDDFVLLAPDPDTLCAWRDAIAAFLQTTLDLQLRDAGRIAPVSAGVDFLGYRVRATHLICRPRVVGHCHEALTAWRQHWVRSGPASTVIDLPDAAREALAASVASYAAHFKHAAHARLWRRLRARHGVLRTLFQPPVAGGCRPLWQPPCPLYRLPDQWRWFHQQCPQWFGWPPGAQAEGFRPWLLWVQVGRMVETYGDHAQRIAAHWPGHAGQPIWRRGLGAGLAWPGQQRPALMAQACRCGWHSAWVSESGLLHHGGQQRVLRRLLLAQQHALLTPSTLPSSH